MARPTAKATPAAAAAPSAVKATPTTRQSALEKEKQRLREQALSKPKGEKQWGKFSTSTSSAQTKSTISTRSKTVAANRVDAVEPVIPVAAVAADKVKKRATPKAAQPKRFESYLPTPGDSPVSDNNESTQLVKRSVAPKSAPRLRRDSMESYLGAPVFALEDVEAKPRTGFSIRVWTSSTLMSPPSLKRKEMYGEGDWTSDEESDEEATDEEDDIVRPNTKRRRVESVEPLPEKLQVIDNDNDIADGDTECEESDDEDVESVKPDEDDEDIPTISSAAVLAELTGQTEEAVVAERAERARKAAMEQAKKNKRSFDEDEDDIPFLPKHKRARTSTWAFPSSSSKASASSSRSAAAASGGSSKKTSHTAKRNYDLSDDDDDEEDDDNDELVPGNEGIQKMFAQAVFAAKRKLEKNEAHLKPHERTVVTSTHECLLPNFSKDRKPPVQVERAAITGAPVKQSKKRGASGSKKTTTPGKTTKPKESTTSEGAKTAAKATPNKRKTACKRKA